ncbi:MAG: GDYXXLXY domain-containing protein [Thiovulaceae bacterium]|nr:GDYXXLXY domain-containing protein [Sulfurimonadaceae bacterium]
MNKTSLLVFGSVLIFVVINGIIWQKEHHIANAIEVKIGLQPLDPRSIMQGDYMRLRYDFLKLKTKGLPKSGLLKINLDHENFITKITPYNNEELKKNEYLIQFSKKRYNRVHIAAESFMFEEGKGDYYAKATHAKLLITKDGATLLKGLYVPPQILQSQ